MTARDVGRQIETFLRCLLAETRPTRIVTVERKGTALLRTLVESRDGAGEAWVGWDNVIANDALPATPGVDLRTGVTLVLDDAIRSGRQVRELLSYLVGTRGVPETNIVVAAFAVHRHSTFVPGHRWLGQLEEPRYREVRAAMVRHFQQSGSLLLDTEHIEVPVRLNCPRAEFFDALARIGTAVEYVSDSDRVNLTIQRPSLLAEKEFRRRLPPGTVIDTTVCKVRVINRAGPEFALIPIFFPSTPANDDPRLVTGLGPPLDVLGGDAVRNFYLVGLHGALHLLRSAMAAIRELVLDGKVWIENPRPGAGDDRLSHIKAVLPGIDVAALHERVQATLGEGLDTRLRTTDRNCQVVEASRGTAAGERLASLKEGVLAEALWYSERVPQGPSGATMAELLRLARSSPHTTVTAEQALLSAAIDVAVDSGELSAGVGTTLAGDGIARCVRVFTLDNEITRAQVRRDPRTWGFAGRRYRTALSPLRANGSTA